MPARVVNSRLRLLLLGILLTFAALGLRAAWIQTVRASSLAGLAQAQAKSDLVLPAARGTIYDRLGNPLAIGEQATDVIADPMQISNPRHEARVASARELVAEFAAAAGHEVIELGADGVVQRRRLE